MIVDGYVRVSKLNGREGQSFISPLVQREQIAGWAAGRGAAIASVFEEFEESGGRADRPLLMQAISRVESGLTDGIVVSSLDRFGRSLMDGLAAIDRIQAAGGTFVAVGDGFDLTTDTGQLVLRIMLSIAEWELDRVRLQWNTAREHAVRRGLHHGRRAPVGYVRRPDRRLAPDSLAAPVITELFRRRVTGVTLRELAEYLTDQGVPAVGARWRPDSVGQILRNRVYLGEVRSGSFVNTTAHAPLVDNHVWQAAQTSKPGRLRRQARRPTLLGGLLRCAGCGLALSSRTVTRGNGTQYRVYACNGEAAMGACPSRATIVSGVVEPYVDAAFFGLLWAAGRYARTHPRLLKLTASLTQARAETVRYRDSARALRTLGGERFGHGLGKRVACEQRLRLALDAERARLGIAAGLDAGHLEATWPSMSISERRVAMTRTIEAIVVVRGPRPSSERIFICPRGDALPHGGRLDEPITPDSLAALRHGARVEVEQNDPWPEARVRQELAEFLAGQKAHHWPKDDHFVHEGRGPLLRQLGLHGGAPRWIREFGLAGPAGRSSNPG